MVVSSTLSGSKLYPRLPKSLEAPGIKRRPVQALSPNSAATADMRPKNQVSIHGYIYTPIHISL